MAESATAAKDQVDDNDVNDDDAHRRHRRRADPSRQRGWGHDVEKTMMGANVAFEALESMLRVDLKVEFGLQGKRPET